MRHLHLLLLPAISCWTVAGSAQETVPQYLRDYEQSGLPPLGDRIEFENQRGFPPQPEGLRVIEDVRPDVRADPQPPITRLMSTSREVALRDIRVRSALGERFALLGGGPVTPDKRGALTGEQISLDFYSYSRNQAFNVLLAGDAVLSITAEAAGYQPPETREEVAAAAAIVARDTRFTAAVRNLQVRGIQTPSGSRNRHLYLLFYKAGQSSAVFQATVDMTLARVVSAGAIQR